MAQNLTVSNISGNNYMLSGVSTWLETAELTSADTNIQLFVRTPPGVFAYGDVVSCSWSNSGKTSENDTNISFPPAADVPEATDDSGITEV